MSENVLRKINIIECGDCDHYNEMYIPYKWKTCDKCHWPGGSETAIGCDDFKGIDGLQKGIEVDKVPRAWNLPMLTINLLLFRYWVSKRLVRLLRVVLPSPMRNTEDCNLHADLVRWQCKSDRKHHKKVIWANCDCGQSWRQPGKPLHRKLEFLSASIVSPENVIDENTRIKVGILKNPIGFTSTRRTKDESE